MYGYGRPPSAIKRGHSNRNVDFDDFGQVLSSLGIHPRTNQKDLQKIYEQAVESRNKEVVLTLDKYFDWWN